MTIRLEALEDIEAAIWRELHGAAHDAHHAWRTPVLATLDGTQPDARTVVLREVDADARELLFFSDARAGKVAQLQAHPEGTVVAWSRALGWQLRLRVQLEAETDGLAVSSRWARLRRSPSAQDYLSLLPPGSPLSGSTPPARGERAYFAVITARVRSIDWLELHPDGHRRAAFGDGPARWLQA